MTFAFNHYHHYYMNLKFLSLSKAVIADFLPDSPAPIYTRLGSFMILALRGCCVSLWRNSMSPSVLRPSSLLDDGRSSSFLKSQLISPSLVPFRQQDAVAPLEATLLPGSLHSALARHSWEGSRGSPRKLFCALQARLCFSCGRSSAQDSLLPRRAPWAQQQQGFQAFAPLNDF